MAKELGYIELAMALANHVHKKYYKLEARINLPPIKIFDDVCMTNFQIPAGVLTRLGILTPLDGLFRYHVFICEPRNFESTIHSNIKQGCSYDTVILSLICLVELETGSNTEIFSKLVDLGICKKNLKRIPQIASGFKVLDASGDEVLMSVTEWTDRKAHYDRICRDWPILIA